MFVKVDGHQRMASNARPGAAEEGCYL
jgi:hypothetical protein